MLQGYIGSRTALNAERGHSFIQIFKGTYPDASVAEVYFFNHSMLPACHGTSSKKKNGELGIPSMGKDRKRKSDVMTKKFDQ